jgi:hypothetical protein
MQDPGHFIENRLTFPALLRKVRLVIKKARYAAHIKTPFGKKIFYTVGRADKTNVFGAL